MAFNSQTYRSNKYRKSAFENLATARDIKTRDAKGEAYGWELPRIAVFVKLARSDMRLHLLTRKAK